MSLQQKEKVDELVEKLKEGFDNMAADASKKLAEIDSTRQELLNAEREKLKPLPEIKEIHGAILKQMVELRKKNPEWSVRDAYKECSAVDLATVAMIYYRLWLFKCEYKGTNPFVSNVPNAAKYRKHFTQYESNAKGAGFVGFLNYLFKDINKDIYKVHYTVLAAFTQHQKEQLFNKSMIDIDYTDPVKVGMVATFKLECERLSLLFSDVCSGMYDVKKVQDPNFPNDKTKTADMVGVSQVPPYISNIKSLDEFDIFKLPRFIENYRLGVRCCVIAMQVQSVFDIIKNQRVNNATTEKEKADEFPVMYRKPYATFQQVFSPFIDQRVIKANHHVKELVKWLEWEIMPIYDTILIERCPGNDLLSYQRPIEDQREIDELKAKGVKPSFMYEDHYAALMIKICQTSVRRRSPVLLKQMIEKKPKLKDASLRDNVVVAVANADNDN